MNVLHDILDAIIVVKRKQYELTTKIRTAEDTLHKASAELNDVDREHNRLQRLLDDELSPSAFRYDSTTDTYIAKSA